MLVNVKWMFMDLGWSCGGRLKDFGRFKQAVGWMLINVTWMLMDFGRFRGGGLMDFGRCWQDR